MKRIFKIIYKTIETALKIWWTVNLTLEEKITIFKTLPISKIIHLASVTVLTNFTIIQSIKTYKEFIGNHKGPIIKEKTN